MKAKYQDRKKQYDATYYEKHKDEIKARTKKYREENAERIAVYMVEYYKAHREKLLKDALQRQRENLEDHNRANIEWRKRNPECIRACKSRRRTRIRANMDKIDIDISIEYRKAIAKDPCFYCGSPGEHDDHYQALADNGTDHWWNLVRACKACNIKKATMHGDDFIKLLRSS